MLGNRFWPFRKDEENPPANSALKLLRDESGTVLVATAPLIPAKAARETQPAPALRTAAQPAVRAVTQHCRFVCRWCESLLLLPHERIGLAFGPPALRKIEVRSIASVCGSCGHVAAFSLFRGSIGYDTRNNQIPAQPQGETILLDWLKCQEPTCPFPLPLFVTREQPLSIDEARELASQWDWADLTCSSSHRILAPLWLFNRQPFQFPTPLR